MKEISSGKIPTARYPKTLKQHAVKIVVTALADVLNDSQLFTFGRVNRDDDLIFCLQMTTLEDDGTFFLYSFS